MKLFVHYNPWGGKHDDIRHYYKDLFQSTSEKKSCFKVTNQMPQKIEIMTAMQVIIQHFSLNLCVRKRALHKMQSENRAKEIPMCDFIVNGWAMKVLCVCVWCQLDNQLQCTQTLYTNTPCFLVQFKYQPMLLPVIMLPSLDSYWVENNKPIMLSLTRQRRFRRCPPFIAVTLPLQ